MPEEYMPNAVQPAGWYTALPRPEYRQLSRVEVNNDWFEVYRLPHDVYALYEPGHFQEVISYLILGGKRALLWDTGLGIGNIQSVVSQLTSMELSVVNSHFHFDHIGDNHRFQKTYIFDEATAVRRLHKGYNSAELLCQTGGDSFWKTVPPGFDPRKWEIPPVQPALLHQGDRFDLGDRTLEVLHTPGHTADSIMLWDRDNRILFTGDTFYPAALYAHFNDEYYGYSNLSTYLTTMEKLSRLIPELDYLYCSHNVPLAQPILLKKTAEAFRAIFNKDASFRIDEEGLRRYDFDGFSVITGDNF